MIDQDKNMIGPLLLKFIENLVILITVLWFLIEIKPKALMVKPLDTNLNWLGNSPLVVTERETGKSFFGTEEAAIVLQNEEFLELYQKFEVMAEEAEE